MLCGGAHWCHLANTTEPSVCGDDVAFLSNYFEHLFNIDVRWLSYRRAMPCLPPVVNQGRIMIFSVL